MTVSTAPGINWAAADLATCKFGSLAAAAARTSPASAPIAASDQVASLAPAAIVADLAVVGLFAYGLRRLLQFIYAPAK